MTSSPSAETVWRDPVDELYSRPGFLIRRAHQIAVGVFLDAAKGACTTTQYGALVVLSACEGLDQIGLARRLGVDRSTSALVVGKLEEAGHLRRAADLRDRRRNTLELTPQGRAMLQALAGPAEQARRALLSALTPAEGDEMIRLLDIFVATFNSDARAPITVASDEAAEAAIAPLRLQTDAPALAALYARPGFLLRRANQIGVSLFLSEVEAQRVTTAQYGVLMILRHCEGLDQLDVSRKVGLDRTTTALVVRKLEAKRLAVKVPDAADRRRNVIVLTGRGERMLEALREPAARARTRALSVFTSADADRFLLLLAKVVDCFNARARAPIPPVVEAQRAASPG